jgi:triacylglycerol lipase
MGLWDEFPLSSELWQALARSKDAIWILVEQGEMLASRTRERRTVMSYNAIEITRKIRAAGHEMSPDAMGAMAAIAPFHETAPYKGVTFQRDVSYGPDPRNRLDVCTADGFKAGDDRDVLVFIHGGGFVRGDKTMQGSPYHDNVVLWAARNGLVGVNMTYRLAPDHKYPSGIEDIAAAVEWIGANIKKLGGSAKRIFLFGSSAGATHAAGYVTHGKALGGAPVAGAVLQSGIYDLSILANHENGNAYFGNSAAKLAEYSSQPGLIETKTPILYVLPEFDAPMFEQGHLAFVNAYAKRHNAWPDFIRLMGHNHFSATASLNSPDNSLGQAMLEFMDGAPR